MMLIRSVAAICFSVVAAMPAFLTVALVPRYLCAMDRADYDPFRSAVEVPQWRRQWTLWRAARRYGRMMRG